MATKINYDNKAYLQNDEDIPNKNKVTASDMNEIKTAVNGNADELDTAKDDIEDLQQGRSTAESDITNLKNRTTVLETDNATNKQNIKDLQSDMQTADGRMAYLEGKDEINTEKIDNLEIDNTANKQNIQTLQTDNATNKKNIADLQENDETQDTEIEKLQSENEALKEEVKKNRDQIPTGVATGETLHLTDSSDLPFKKFGVIGKSWQETREGYNLLNVPSEYTVTSFSNIMDLSLEPGSYTIKFDDVTTSNENVNSYVCVFMTENAVISYQHITKTEKKKTFNLSSATTKFKIWSADSTDESQNVTTTYKNLMIYAGTDDKEYEEYGVSPSTNYPSTIRNAGEDGSVNFEVCNKNIFNKDDFNELSAQIFNNVIYSTYTERTIYFKCKKNCSYVFQKKLGTNYKRFMIAETKEKPAINVEIQNGQGNANQENLIYTTSDTAEYIVFWYYCTGSDLSQDEILDSIQIEENNVATEFEEHQEQSISFLMQERTSIKARRLSS